MTPLFPDDAARSQSPGPLTDRPRRGWDGSPAMVSVFRNTARGRSAAAGHTNRLGRFVLILFISGALVPLIFFMTVQYRNHVRDQIDDVGSRLIDASFIAKTNLENFIATRYDFLDHMASLMAPPWSGRTSDDMDILRTKIMHDANILGFDRFIFADRSGVIRFSWPDKDLINTRVLPAQSSLPEWAVFLGKSLETAERFCVPPAGIEPNDSDRLAHISLPIIDENGRMTGAASGGLRKALLSRAMDSASQRHLKPVSYLLCNDFQVSLDLNRNDSPERAHMTSPGVLYGEKMPWPNPITSYRDSKGNRYIGIRTRMDSRLLKGGDWSLVTETSLEPMFDRRNQFIRSALKILAGSLFLILLLSAVLSHETVRAIGHYLTWARHAADGKILTLERPQGNHEIAELGKSLSDISIRMRELIRFCSSLSQGDLGRTFSVRGDHDDLGLAIGGIRLYFESLLKKIEHISDGRFVLPDQDDSASDQLSHKLLKLSQSLNRMNEGNMRLISATFAQMELIRQMSGEQNLTSMINTVLTFLCRHLKVQIGSLYVHDQRENAFVRHGTYGAMKQDFPDRILPGECLCGQSIVERKPLFASQTGPNAPNITTGLGHESTVALMAFPFILRHEVIAVVELAGFREFKPEHTEFLQKNNESIAIAIHSALARDMMETLLAKTVEQAESLKKQQDQLSLANRELAEQADALKKSETRLMARETELEAANRALEAHSKRLEEQKLFLDQKNRELEETKSVLEIKADELTRSNQYKSEFLANMSHELRTPLNSIILLSKTLVDKLGADPTSNFTKFATIIHASGKDLLNLIDGVLDLTKLSSGDMGVKLGPYDLHETERVLRYWFGKPAKDKNLAFDVTIGDNLPRTILTDPPKLEKILKSLLSNAIKYTTEGRVTVDIRRPHRDVPLPVKGLDHSSTVEISITDTGEGIPENMQGLIFEAFKQVDGTITRRHGGTGLGLSLAQEFARLLQGEILLMHSDPGGSTFSLFLPEKGPDLSKPTTRITTRKGMRIAP